jgi:tRNA pseudouridine38-40 synthase
MNRYFIKLAYSGKNYHGWQIQENAHTVQAELNDKLSKLTGQNVHVIGCGRTDAGVHAREFYAHFDTEKLPMEADQLAYKLDHFLPADIATSKIFKVAADSHSRFSAVSRTYSYYITRVKDPFDQEFSYYYHGPLNVAAMSQAAKYLLTKQDFTSFSKLHTQTKTNICDVIEANWHEENNRLIFTISADRFLRNMVRAVVGTLLEIGKGKLNPKDMESIILAKDRSRAGFSAPAHGLVLEKVLYDF